MKKGLWLPILIYLIFWAGFIAIAQEEIPITPIPRPSITKITVDTIRILRYTRTVEITLRYLDADGGRVKEKTLIYMDKVDDPETPQDEFCDDYTVLMTGLGINKVFLKNAIKAKLAEE